MNAEIAAVREAALLVEMDEGHACMAGSHIELCSLREAQWKCAFSFPMLSMSLRMQGVARGNLRCIPLSVVWMRIMVID